MWKRALIAVILLAMLVSLSSCDLIFSSKKQTTVSVTVDYGDEKETLEFKFGEVNNFTPKYKKEKVLVGFFGQNQAVGKEYADFKGKTIPWCDGVPETIYAVYEDIDYELTYTSKFFYDEDPRSFYYGGGEGHTLAIKVDFESSPLYKVLYCNPQLDIELTVSSLIKKEGSRDISVTFTVILGSETLKSKNYNLTQDTWKEASLSTEIKGKQLIKSGQKLYTRYVYNGSYAGSNGLVKNISYSVKIISPSSNVNV